MGILSFRGTTDDEIREWVKPFRGALADQGWVEGKNVAFEYRGARTDPSQPVEAAAELARLKVDVIFADSAPALRAAHVVTRSIPIVAIDLTTDPRGRRLRAELRPAWWKHYRSVSRRA